MFKGVFGGGRAIGTGSAHDNQQLLAAGEIDIDGSGNDGIVTAAGADGDFRSINFCGFLCFLLTARGESRDGTAAGPGSDARRSTTAQGVISTADAAHFPTGHGLGKGGENKGKLEKSEDCKLKARPNFRTPPPGTSCQHDLLRYSPMQELF
jgi:hypothetical protein